MTYKLLLFIAATFTLVLTQDYRDFEPGGNTGNYVGDGYRFDQGARDDGRDVRQGNGQTDHHQSVKKDLYDQTNKEFDRSKVDNNDRSKVDNNDRSQVDNSDRSQVDNSDRSKVDNTDRTTDDFPKEEDLNKESRDSNPGESGFQGNFTTDPIINMIISASWRLLGEMQTLVRNVEKPLRDVVQTVQKLVNHPTDIVFRIMEPRLKCNYTLPALNTDNVLDNPCEHLVSYCEINKSIAECQKEGICRCVKKTTKT